MEQATAYLAARPAARRRPRGCSARTCDGRPLFSTRYAGNRVFGVVSGAVLLPCTPGFADDPLFWALAAAQDPDAVVVHPGTYGEIERAFEPDLFHRVEAEQRQDLQGRFGGRAIEDAIKQWRDEPLRAPGGRGAARHGDRPTTRVVASPSPSGHDGCGDPSCRRVSRSQTSSSCLTRRSGSCRPAAPARWLTRSNSLLR